LCALSALPQAWACVVLNGRLAPANVVVNKMLWYSPHALQILFSTDHGLFFWTPLALVCVFGLFALATPPDTRRVAFSLLLMFLAQVYISGSVDTWTVAGSFGQRRFL